VGYAEISMHGKRTRQTGVLQISDKNHQLKKLIDEEALDLENAHLLSVCPD
jgi:hypothetical protein